jgi:hypothetical protein
MIVIDMTKFRDYKWCSRGILAAVCRCGSRWFQSGFRCFEKISALDGVLKPSSPLPGSTGANQAQGRVWRAPWCRWTVMLLGGVGVLAFLLSAVLPDDDTLQQELFHSRTSLRVVDVQRFSRICAISREQMSLVVMMSCASTGIQGAIRISPKKVDARSLWRNAQAGFSTLFNSAVLANSNVIAPSGPRTLPDIVNRAGYESLPFGMPLIN